MTGVATIDQRYYASAYGRFNTPDPYGKSILSKSPASWNRYSYTRGDPVNRFDPGGRIDCPSYYSYLLNSVGLDEYDAEQQLGNCQGGITDGSDSLDPCSQQADEFGFSDSSNCSSIYYDQPPAGTGNGGSGGSASPPCPPKYQAFITAYGADAVATGLSEANVLALSSIESDWGNGRFAKPVSSGGGNSFFNLETLSPIGWTPGDPFPKTIYPDQVSWMNALEPFASGPNAGRYSLVATYQNASDAFSSFAAKLGQYFSGVTNAATFGGIAVAHGIYGGRGNTFITREQNFQNCLGAQ